MLPKKPTPKTLSTRALTREQIKFARYVVAGLTKTEAYLRAYQHKDHLAKGGPQWTNAHRTAKKPQVAAYIEQLRREDHEMAQADRREKMRILENQLRDPDLPPRDRREAIKLHNEMTGEHAPIQHQVNLSTDLVALAQAAAR